MSRIQSQRLGLQVAHFLCLANQPRVPFNEPNAQCRLSAENVNNLADNCSALHERLSPNCSKASSLLTESKGPGSNR
jgi:hypothetical protein